MNKTENVTEKIENLNLVALRKYACPKINKQKDWYLKCVDCKGLNGCPAGKRALEIMETQTKPEEANLANAVKAAAAASVKRTARARERIESAFAGTTNVLTRAQRLLELEKKEISAHALSQRCRSWIKRYPDLDKKYEFNKLAVFFGRNEDKDLTPAKLLKKYFSTSEEDEVSIDDFLSEGPGDISEEPVANPVGETPVAEEEPVKPATDTVPTPTSQQEMMKLEFGKKRLELKKRIAYITEEIERMTVLRSNLIDQVNLLDSTAQLFGFAPTNVINAKL